MAMTRHGRWLFGIVMLIAADVGEAEEFSPESRIAAVTVFPDRAMITRRAELKLAKGEHRVVFPSLPGSIEPDSVAARGSGEAKVRLLGAQLSAVQLESADSEKVRELERQIEQAQDRTRHAQQVKEILQQERKFLASIQAASGEQIGKDLITKQPQVGEVSALLSFLDEQLTGIAQKDLQADVQLRELAEQLDKLARELAQLRGGSRRQHTQIAVDLEADDAGRFTLEVSYRLPGASWQPVYEARAQGQAETVELIAYGLIRQRTGEEWRDVALSLSTARPAVGGRMPEIEPWWLAPAPPPMPMRKGRVAGLMAPADAPMSSEAFMDAAEEKQEATLAEAVVETRGPAVVYALARPETIASDWQPRKAPIATHRLAASLGYETTPRLSPYAYLHASVTNKTEQLLLPGALQVFLDNSFVGGSQLDLVGPGERFDLYLGIDERIRVERRLLKAKADVSVLPGLHGRSKTIDYAFLTTLENFRPAAVSVTVIDQVPVSQHDEIKVEQVSFEPKPDAQDSQKPGVQRWTFRLPTLGKQSIALSYRVRHPVELPVAGLEP